MPNEHFFCIFYLNYKGKARLWDVKHVVRGVNTPFSLSKSIIRHSCFKLDGLTWLMLLKRQKHLEAHVICPE